MCAPGGQRLRLRRLMHWQRYAWQSWAGRWLRISADIKSLVAILGLYADILESANAIR